MSSIKVIKSTQLKPKFDDPKKLPFGRMFTDHMLTMKYTPDKKWHDMTIEPYADFKMDPASMVLHYGQGIFEGMKAYRDPDNKIRLFRPRDNFERLNRSGARIKIPPINVDEVMEGLMKLLEIEKDWVPEGQGTSLYMRPSIVATDPFLGVRPSETYLFFIILCPVGLYYTEGFNPVGIYVEDEYVRAVRGGVGEAKVIGNYAASLLASSNAKEKGFSQVLWLDGLEHKYCEEVGAMNIFFEFDNEVVTPALSGSILPGITRRSIIQLCKDMGKNVVERPISIQEVYDRSAKGELREVFGTGTAAVISPVGRMCWEGKEIIINDNITGETTQKMFDTLTGIQGGFVEDNYGWSVIVPNT